MLSISILCVGKVKERFFSEAIDEYKKRLSRYCKLEILEVPDEKIPEKLNDKIEQDIKNKECERIISHIKKDSLIFCLDLKGKEYSSEEFSKLIDKVSIESSNITFVIGGSLGISEKMLKLSDKKICFSKMTFPHQLIRVFLLEQIFRAFKISNGEVYHR